MSSMGFRCVTSCISSCVINLGWVAWGLFLLEQGWDLRQSGADLMREGSATLLAGGLFLLLAGLAGIIHAVISLRQIAKSSKRPSFARAPSVDTAG